MSYNAPPPPPADGGGDSGYNAPPPPNGGYGQGGYGQGGYGAPGPRGNNKMALWSMILGILSIPCCGIVLGPIAVVLSRQATGQIAQTGEGGAGMAKAGLICGIIGAVLGIIWILLSLTGAVDTSFSTN